MNNKIKNNKAYQEYLNSSHWQKVKEECLTYYRLRCYCCNVPMEMSALEVYHMHYKTLGRENYRKDVVSLCKRCYEQIHLQESCDRDAVEVLKNKTEQYSDYLHSADNPHSEAVYEYHSKSLGFISVSDILKAKYKNNSYCNH